MVEEIENASTTEDSECELVDEMTLEEASRYKFVSRHTNLCGLWNEWHGLGEHSGDRCGGVLGRNQRFGSKWRKDEPKPKVHSRMKLSITHDRRTVFLTNKCQTSEGVDHSRKRQSKAHSFYFSRKLNHTRVV